MDIDKIKNIEKNKKDYKNRLIEAKILWNNKIRNVKGMCEYIKGNGDDCYMVFVTHMYKIQIRYKIFIYSPKLLDIEFVG